MPSGSRYRGWRWDADNSRLHANVAGTDAMYVTASGFTTPGGEITNSVVQAAGIAPNAVTVAKLGANLAVGFIPIPLTSWLLVASNDVPAIAVASGNGGKLAVDTAPKLIRINAATDKGLRIQWAAASVVEIMADILYPPDFDDTAILTFNMLASMGGATDIPVVTVGYFEGLDDTDAGGATGAVTGTTITAYTRAITAANVGAYPNKASIQLTPAAHGTDVLNVYATWMTYTRKT